MTEARFVYRESFHFPGHDGLNHNGNTPSYVSSARRLVFSFTSGGFLALRPLDGPRAVELVFQQQVLISL